MITRMFQISEDDLQVLETELPSLMGKTAMSCNDPIIRKQWEIIRQVVSNVRWNYGPPSEVIHIPSEGHE